MALPDNPTLSLTFEGLMLLQFGANKDNCRIGFLPEDNRHCIKIKIESSPLRDPFPIILKDQILTGDIFFEVEGRAEGVATYENGFFNRTSGVEDEKDFRWVVDLEADDFHRGPQVFDESKFSQRMFVKQGLFYTALKRSVVIRRNGMPDRFAEVARTIGCNVHLNANETAVLRYGPTGAETIRLVNEPGTHYLISVVNSCVTTATATPAPPTVLVSGDFTRYYEVASQIPAAYRFDILAERPDLPNGRLPDTPCDPATGG